MMGQNSNPLQVMLARNNLNTTSRLRQPTAVKKSSSLNATVSFGKENAVVAKKSVTKTTSSTNLNKSVPTLNLKPLTKKTTTSSVATARTTAAKGLSVRNTNLNKTVATARPATSTGVTKSVGLKRKAADTTSTMGTAPKTARPATARPMTARTTTTTRPTTARTTTTTTRTVRKPTAEEKSKKAAEEAILAAQRAEESLREEVDGLKVEIEQLQSTQSANADLQAQLSAALSTEQQAKSALEAVHAQLKEVNLQQSLQITQKSTRIAELEAQVVTLQQQVLTLQGELATAHSLNEERAATISTLTAEKSAAHATIAELEHKRRLEEAIRKKLHNTILELKGNIRVFCRVRPFLPSDNNNNNNNNNMGSTSSASASSLNNSGSSDSSSGSLALPTEVLTIPDNDPDHRTISMTSAARASVDGSKSHVSTHAFNFDRVFGGESTQGEVFEEISQLVQSALDGYAVNIFAYGQTGSGKTFTMEGTAEQAGMIERAVMQIFETMHGDLRSMGWEFDAPKVSFLEIYDEQLRDLLSGEEKEKLEIVHDRLAGRTSVKHLTEVEVTCSSAVHALLQTASKNRAVAATKCNDRSSRSHSVFQLRLNGRNSISNESTAGLLNLIDLAGSERLKVSGATGERQKETVAINKSLSALGDVIVALGNKEKHVPFRNSKLTHLLQYALGGASSKTLMFVNVSPVPSSYGETLCSLRFAAKVNACEIGTARKQSKVGA